MTVIYAGVFALSALALGVIVLVITDRAFRDQIVRFSRVDIAIIQTGYKNEGVLEAKKAVERRLAAPDASDYFLLQQGSTRIAGNLPVMVPQIGTVLLPGPVQDHDIMGVGANIAPGLYAYAGSDFYRAHQAQEQIVKSLAWLYAAAMLPAVLGGALVSRALLRRSDSMAKACRAIMDGDLKARIPVRGTKDELDRLAATINEMLDRIAALMENLRQITNDIAHDLRTPVSHLRQNLESARDEVAATQSEALDAAIRKTDDILNLFAALLRIAQIEGGARRAAFAPVALAPVLQHIHEIFEAVAENDRHHLRMQATQDAIIRGDRALIIQMMSNLVENAIIHTPAGTSIVLALSQNGDRAVITVKDDGPGVPPEEHKKLFQRLYRREASRSRPGYGLGLSMVAAIAELHFATITLDEVAAGLCVQVSFPIASNDA